MTQRQLERLISREYAQARRNIAKTMQGHYENYIRTDAVQKELLKKGDITQADYNAWLNNQKIVLSRDNELLGAVNRELLNADETAAKWINGELPYSYLNGYNDTVHGIDSNINGYSYSLIDKNAVRALADSGDLPIVKYEAGGEKYEAYVDKRARQALTQGVIQGDSVRSVSKNVSKALGDLTDKERKATIRNTRTLMNSAHNTGAYAAMEQATKDGIILDKQWLATKDERTRDSHAYLDGEIKKWNEKFSNGLLYPQDFHGPPAEVYNCRCSMREVVRGFYNKYTGKTEMLGEAAEEEYAKKSRDYWSAVFAEREAEKAAKATIKVAAGNSEHIKNAKALRDEYRQRLANGERYIGHDDLVKVGDEVEQAYLEKMQAYEKKTQALQEEYERAAIEYRKAYEEFNGTYGKEHSELWDKIINSNATEEEKARFIELENKRKEVTRLRKEAQGLKARLDELKASSSVNAYKEAIAEVRGEGFGRGSLSEAQMKRHLNNSSSQVTGKVLDAYEDYPSSWVEASVDRGRLTPRKVDRGYYSDYREVIAISDSPYSTSHRCATHELGHRMERAVPEIKYSEADFYQYRTQGESLEWLGSGYDRSEKTRKDHFDSPYMGKDYGGSAYELASMGYERVMDGRHEAFRAADPEMYRWLTGMLAVY